MNSIQVLSKLDYGNQPMAVPVVPVLPVVPEYPSLVVFNNTLYLSNNIAGSWAWGGLGGVGGGDVTIADVNAIADAKDALVVTALQTAIDNLDGTIEARIDARIAATNHIGTDDVIDLGII